MEVPTVENPWTWDELYENAAKIQAGGNIKYGFAADVSRARYDILMYANGGSLTVKDGDSFKVAINSQANIDTLQTFVDKNNEALCPRPSGRRLHRQPRRLLQERRRGHVLLRFLELQCIHHGHHRL